MGRFVLFAGTAALLTACGASFIGPATNGAPDTIDCHDGTTCPSGYSCVAPLSDGHHCEAADAVPAHWGQMGTAHAADAGKP